MFSGDNKFDEYDSLPQNEGMGNREGYVLPQRKRGRRGRDDKPYHLKTKQEKRKERKMGKRQQIARGLEKNKFMQQD